MLFGVGTRACQSSKGMVLAAWCSRTAGNSVQQQCINSVVMQWIGDSSCGATVKYGRTELVPQGDESHGVAVTKCSK